MYIFHLIATMSFHHLLEIIQMSCDCSGYLCFKSTFSYAKRPNPY